MKKSRIVIFVFAMVLFGVFMFSLGSNSVPPETKTVTKTKTKMIETTPQACKDALADADAVFAGPVNDSVTAYQLLAQSLSDISNGLFDSSLDNADKSATIEKQAADDIGPMLHQYAVDSQACLAPTN